MSKTPLLRIIENQQQHKPSDKQPESSTTESNEDVRSTLMLELLRPVHERYVCKDDTITIALDSSGRLHSKSQFINYTMRGDELEDSNIISFFVDSFEMRTDAQTKPKLKGKGRPPGRPRNDRVLYQSQHPQHKTKQRVLRRSDHNALPNFIGTKFPREDDPDSRDLYCASMLMLLKPWRQLEADLKDPEETWEEAYSKFKSVASPKELNILSSIQYFHECERAAQDKTGNETTLGSGESVETDEDVLEPDQTSLKPGKKHAVTSDGISLREDAHARFAVEQAKQCKVFEDDEQGWDVHSGAKARVGTGNDHHLLERWRTQMAEDVLAHNEAANMGNIPQTMSGRHGGTEVIEAANGVGARVIVLDTINSTAISNEEEEAGRTEQTLTAVDSTMLKEDQYRAYDIITWHLHNVLSGAKPPLLRQIIHGEGGTGKSRVIQTVTEQFVVRGARYMLIKSAYTGIAASIIEGKTTHTIAMINRHNQGKPLSEESKRKLQDFWRGYAYLIIDEMSMISKSFFALLSRIISIAKATVGIDVPTDSFGGINVIICGDFHQFPPVAAPPYEALYYPANGGKDTSDALLGRAIYEEFTTVVILKEQIRCVDPIWHDFLQHLREGRVQERHVKLLQGLVLDHPDCPETDFSRAPWQTAALVTPRHAVRITWNESAVRKHCQLTGNQLFICRAEDTIKGRELSERGRNTLTNRAGQYSLQKKNKQQLPVNVELAIGMKVMVTTNIETDLDITNGARGTIADIILHPEEEYDRHAEEIVTTRLPLYLLVKLDWTRTVPLEGLDVSVIPVEAITQTMQIQIAEKDGKTTRCTVKRRQFPVTPAYAFTDYRSQGQTIPHVIVDIASPPTGGLSLFNLYVALSHSSGRSTIRLLRNFDPKLFQAAHSAELIAEDDRLRALDEETKKQWEKVGRGCRTPHT